MIDPRLGSRLQECLRGDASQVKLDNFNDAALSKYPAIVISETVFTVDEYEAIANYLISDHHDDKR